MLGIRKVRTIYFKELLETLRDRRTLIAMLVVPVLLYPLMMMIMVRIQVYERTELQAAGYTVAVPNQASQALLERVIEQVQGRTDTQPVVLPEGGIRVVVADAAPEALGEEIHAQVMFSPETTDWSRDEDAERRPPANERIVARIVYRQTRVHSDAAARILRQVFQAYQERLVQRSLGEVQVVLSRVDPDIDLERLLHPVELTEEAVDTQQELGGHLLSQIVPFILILMTVTGAVYPAIDLTAGERERGTLETLLAAPVGMLELISGKFLTVATIAILSSLLNVASLAATVRFGGILHAMHQGAVGEVPFRVLPIIILCLIPYAVLASAMMLAVCSFARTAKEAQNYVTPLILATMIPAMVGAMRTVRLEGPMMVAPIANVTLLVRDLLLEEAPWATTSVVLASTSLYAVAAIALATRLFGQEAVIFADAVSIRSLVLRRYLRPRPTPSAALALVVTAVLFPVTYYAQTQVQLHRPGDFAWFLKAWGILQFVLLVGVPALLCWYLKIDRRTTFRLPLPSPRFWAVALLLGAGSPVVVIELVQIQARYFHFSDRLAELQEPIATGLWQLGPFLGVLLLAVLPATAEELLFRGFLLSGLSTALRKWGVIVAVAVVFGVFHFMAVRFATAALMGVLLAYLCWQAGSVWPGVLAHLLHNGLMAMVVYRQEWLESTGLLSFSDDPQVLAIPRLVVGAALLALLLALFLCTWPARQRLTASVAQG